ncbi:ATP-binding cassette domain-containing protein [uncultured Aquitalea sp.]|uniref:ATP-binding cassette domain-containing protein n=1 Tax=uncultured Aquitalea sp. TaxID=540272 RepID=UPI0025E351ED|nr:ATP-binding cassette domain-containing protein [uncultured Aquitalea sp.]
MKLDLHIRRALGKDGQGFQLDVALRTDCQRVVILGPSGAGKSLTLKAMAGLMTPDAGHIRLDGRTLFDSASGVNLPPQQRGLAYLFQDYALFPHLTVRQNIAFPLRRGLFNAAKGSRDPAVEHWLTALDIARTGDLYPEQLSGGQRQRAALARALVARPQAILLDEPFAALDQALRDTMRAELDRLQRELRVPMVLITHDPEDAAVFGQQVVLLRDGRVDTPAAQALAASPQGASSHA